MQASVDNFQICSDSFAEKYIGSNFKGQNLVNLLITMKSEYLR